jgi:hypothetical protein
MAIEQLWRRYRAFHAHAPQCFPAGRSVANGLVGADSNAAELVIEQPLDDVRGDLHFSTARRCGEDRAGSPARGARLARRDLLDLDPPLRMIGATGRNDASILSVFGKGGCEPPQPALLAPPFHGGARPRG